MSNINALYDKAVEFHGHSCPGLAIGVVASKIALEEFGERIKDEELVAIVENDACGVDAIQILLGCTFGKGNMIHKDYGKSAYTFFNRETGKAIRLLRKKSSYNDLESQKKHRELFEKVQKDNISEKELAEYKKIRQKLINTILESGRNVFTKQDINILPPKKARIHESVICDNCQEPTMATRIKENDKRKLCIPCYEAIHSH
jgi:formylmethanofuran dehydrogenase subunit E